MKGAIKLWLVFPALVSVFTGCASSGLPTGTQTHLSAAQCRDLTEIRHGAPITRERDMGELAALERAGYHPEWSLDPYYPADLQAAQQRVNFWYQTECAAAQRG
jgi:hypothetical protein